MDNIKLFEEYNNLIKLELSSILIPFLGFNINLSYSDFSPENILDEDEEEWENFDYDLYTDFITDCAKIIFNEDFLPEVKRFFPNFKKGLIVNYHSGKGESIYFDLYFTKNLKGVLIKFIKILPNLMKIKLNNFLKETYKSYPGFASFMPKSIHELYEVIEDEDYVRAFSALMTAILYIDERCEWDENEVKHKFTELVLEKQYEYAFFK